MAGNAFSKQYLTELLNTKIAEAKAALDADTIDADTSDAERLLSKMKRENLLDQARAIEGVRAILDEAAALVAGINEKTYVNAPSDDATIKITQDLERVVNSYRNFEVTRGRNTYEVVAAVKNQINSTKVRGIRPSHKTEIERMERVLDYVTKAPTDEFSMTLMRSLGFLDIIKAALN